MNGDDLQMFATVGAFGAAIVGGVVGAVGAWFWAPQVGGAMWPYIHVGVAIVGGGAGLTVGPLVFYGLALCWVFLQVMLGGAD